MRKHLIFAGMIVAGLLAACAAPQSTPDYNAIKQNAQGAQQDLNGQMMGQPAK